METGTRSHDELIFCWRDDTIDPDRSLCLCVFLGV